MRKLIFTTFLFILVADCIHAQENNSNKDTIDFNESYWFPTYKYHGKRINFMQMRRMVKNDPAAFEIFKQRRIFAATTIIMAGVGGFLIGYNMGVPHTSKRQANLFAGVTITVGSIVTNYLAYNKVKTSIALYNGNLNKTGNKGMSLNFGLNSSLNGVGIIIKI